MIPLTVLLPAHNASETIDLAIRSILNQTFKDFYFWILENGSTDNTLEIARKYENEQVKVFELGPIGFQNALQWGIDNAQTEYLARMDADDICLPNRLELQMKAMMSNKNYSLNGTDQYYLTPFGNVFSINTNYKTETVDEFSMSQLPEYKKGFFSDPSVVFRTDIARKVGGYDSEFNVGDVSLWIKMLKVAPGLEINEKSFIYFLNPKSMSSEIEYNYQTHLCREKHFENYVAPPKPNNNLIYLEINPKWLQIALMEISGGNKINFIQALKNSGKKISIIDRLKVLLSPIYLKYLDLYHGLKFQRHPELEEYINELKNQR